VRVGDSGGDVGLEAAGSAGSEVNVEVVAVEVGRDGGDEAAAVDVDEFGGLAVAEFVDEDAVARAVRARGPRGSPAVAGRRSIGVGAGAGWRSRSASRLIGQTSCWRLVRITLIRVCWTSAPWGVRLPPQFLRLTTAGRTHTRPV